VRSSWPSGQGLQPASCTLTHTGAQLNLVGACCSVASMRFLATFTCDRGSTLQPASAALPSKHITRPSSDKTRRSPEGLTSNQPASIHGNKLQPCAGRVANTAATEQKLTSATLA